MLYGAVPPKIDTEPSSYALHGTPSIGDQWYQWRYEMSNGMTLSVIPDEAVHDNPRIGLWECMLLDKNGLLWDDVKCQLTDQEIGIEIGQALRL